MRFLGASWPWFWDVDHDHVQWGPFTASRFTAASRVWGVGLICWGVSLAVGCRRYQVYWS